MEKELKRYLKRKIRISLAVVVSFLITGSVSLSSIVSSNDILIENDKLILGKLSEKMSENTPIYGENIPIDERGNGILEKSLINTEINNSGIIKGNLDMLERWEKMILLFLAIHLMSLVMKLSD